MSPRSRRILATTTAALALGLISWRAWRTSVAAPSSPSVPLPSPALPPPSAVDAPLSKVAPAAVFTPPLPESPEARFRRQVADMAAEFDQLRSLPDDIENFRSSAELENEYAAALEENPALAAMLVREMPAGFTDTHFGVLALVRWAATERTAAAEWMAANPAATPSAAQALAQGWLAQDEKALTTHLASLPAGAWRSNLALTASEDAFVAKRPETVLSLLASASPDDPRHSQLEEWNATAWAIQDVEAAAAWAAAHAEPARRQALLAAVVIGEANRDPAAAAERLTTSVTEPERRSEATRAIARIWTARDPAAAARWAAELTNQSQREAAEEGLMAIASP